MVACRSTHHNGVILWLISIVGIASTDATLRFPLQATIGHGLVKVKGVIGQCYAGNDGSNKEEVLQGRHLCDTLSILGEIDIALKSICRTFIVEPVLILYNISFSVVIAHAHEVDIVTGKILQGDGLGVGGIEFCFPVVSHGLLTTDRILEDGGANLGNSSLSVAFPSFVPSLVAFLVLLCSFIPSFVPSLVLNNNRKEKNV